jgi:hypothetical protein
MPADVYFNAVNFNIPNILFYRRYLPINLLDPVSAAVEVTSQKHTFAVTLILFYLMPHNTK